MGGHALQPEPERFEVDSGHDFQRHQGVAEQGGGERPVRQSLAAARKVAFRTGAPPSVSRMAITTSSPGGTMRKS